MNYVELHHRTNVPVHCKSQEDYMHLFAISPKIKQQMETKRKAM